MENHTITTFILVGLTDDPQLQIPIFMFLFLTYMLSITGNLTIIFLTLVDPHLKTPMYYFLQKFALLEISFTTACIPRYLYNIATGDKTITYTICIIQTFYTDVFGVTEFPSGHHVLWPLCGHLQNPSLCDQHEQESLPEACPLLLDVWLVDHTTTLDLFLNLKFCDSCNWLFFLWCISYLEDLILRHMAHRAVDYCLCCADLHSDPCMCCSILHLHHQNHSKTPFCSAKQKSFFQPVFLIWLWFPSPMEPVSSSTSNLQQKNQWLLTRVWQC